jgi:hypothetical protein
MNVKKTLGYTFIVLASIMLIIIIDRYHAVDSAVKGIFMLLSSEMEPHRVWRAVGRFTYWVAHFIATFMLWIYGKKWIGEN